MPSISKIFMQKYFNDYLEQQKQALDSIPVEAVERITLLLKAAHKDGKNIFVFGNGGSAANASHFATDLGKGASDKVGPFRVLSLNDNTAWMTALGNDYSYDDVFTRQLMNYASEGDVLLTMSVSGNSPNLLKAVAWANDKGLHTIALVGGRRGKLASLARHVVVVDSQHYGRVEDCHMTIAHMLCYAFMEQPS
jgi:D-sedoheptulose 7-phosphate isomerase